MPLYLIRSGSNGEFAIRRIVAKVDRLMALVDQLETQLTTSRATAKNLLQALVAELTSKK